MLATQDLSLISHVENASRESPTLNLQSPHHEDSGNHYFLAERELQFQHHVDWQTQNYDIDQKIRYGDPPQISLDIHTFIGE